MASVTKLPQEIILEITKLLSLKDAMPLLRTCKDLFEISNSRPFWLDQLRQQLLRFKPLNSLDLKTLTLPELRKMATKPYRFEKQVLKRKLRSASLTRLKPSIVGQVSMADIVPGGEWVVTLSVELNPSRSPNDESVEAWKPCLRIWSISAPVMKRFRCAAEHRLPTDFTPLELCLQPGDDGKSILIFVSGALGLDDNNEKGMIEVFSVQPDADKPQLCSLARLLLPSPTDGLEVHGPYVLTSGVNPDSESFQEFVWEWKNNRRVTIPVPPKTQHLHWDLTATLDKIALWREDGRYIDIVALVHGDRWLPMWRNTLPFELPVASPNAMSPIAPTLIKPWNVNDLYTAVLHTEACTIRVDFSSMELDHATFSVYPKDNSHMMDPEDPSNPFGSDVEVPLNLVKTISGHLLDLSPSGRLTTYEAVPEEGTPDGSSDSYFAFDTWQERGSGGHSAFICPFSGVVGTVTEEFDFYIWRMK